MGKVAKRKKVRMRQYFAKVAASNPQEFHTEWNKRMESWLDEVWRRAGRLFDTNGRLVPPAFEVVDTARFILAACGNKDDLAWAYRSIDMLTHEYLRAFSVHVDGRLYHINTKIERT